MTPALAAAGAPADRWVSRVFASPHDAGNGVRLQERLPQRRLPAVALSGRPTPARRGRRSAAISPNAPINVVVQDRKNRNLLIVGNDLGVCVSIDGGAAGRGSRRICRRSPVHDLTIHPRENDLVLGTYGRGDLGRRHHAAAGSVGRSRSTSRCTSSTSSRARATASARSATIICSATSTSKCRTSRTRSSSTTTSAQRRREAHRS